MAKPDARERVLEAADRLFYQQGLRAVGVDTITAAAGVAKMSLYAHFKTKDELIVAYLRRRDEHVLRWFREAITRHGGGPAGLFGALAEWFASDDFRGCAFINAAAELPDPAHPGRAAVTAHKKAFAELVAGALPAGADVPAVLLLIEGAIVTAVRDGTPTAAGVAHRAAEKLLGRRKN